MKTESVEMYEYFFLLSEINGNEHSSLHIERINPLVFSRISDIIDRIYSMTSLGPSKYFVTCNKKVICQGIIDEMPF